MHKSVTVLTLALAGTVFASSAFATNCNFVTECFDADGCAETTFDLSIEEQNGEVTLASEAQTVSVALVALEPAYVYVGLEEGAAHMLTRNPDGDARYTVHFYDGTFVVMYLGTCEGAE